MSNTERTRLLNEAAVAAKAARQITEKADDENRELTPGEKAEFDAKFEEATAKKAAADLATTRASSQREKDAQIMAAARALALKVGTPAPAGATSGDGRGWAKSTADRLIHTMTAGNGGEKALVSGSIGVPNVIDPNVVRVGVVPRTILDLIGIRPARSNGQGGNTFTYLRQTVRTNNAAPVADGALKPTSTYTLAEVEDRFRVIAHLSEPTPQRYFKDHYLLEDFLAAEMEYGLELAVQSQVLTGDGLGENLTGILNTSGIVSVAAVVGDLVATLRKALTALQATGIAPTAFALNPNDMERLDLIREGSGTGQYLLGGPGSKTEQTLWDVPRVASTVIPAGTAILADWPQAELVVREDAEVAVDTSGENFTKNLATMRVEGRYGLAVKRPAAFAEVTLPA